MVGLGVRRARSVNPTPLEIELLTRITLGKSIWWIADQMCMAENQLGLVSSVFDKMGALDRTQATIDALQRGLVHFK